MWVFPVQEIVKEEDDEASDKGSESDEDDTNRDSLSDKDDGSDRDSDREPDEKQSKDDEAVSVTFHCMVSLLSDGRKEQPVQHVSLVSPGKLLCPWSKFPLVERKGRMLFHMNRDDTECNGHSKG